MVDANDDDRRPRGGYAFVRKPIWAFLQEGDRQVVFPNNGNGSGDGCLQQDDSNDFVIQDDDHPNEVNVDTRSSKTSLPPRHLTLFDLVSIGVGGTIGSGIFVLNGLIAHSYAGPAVFLSWILSGFAALLSGCCYAELSGRIPSTGSSYAYTFVALGELPAFIAAGMLSLEFLLSGSAVARSWGDKVVEWARVQLSASDDVIRVLDPGYNINPMACLVSILSTILVAKGIKESKIITDFFTWIKVLLVLFMTVGGTSKSSVMSTFTMFSVSIYLVIFRFHAI
jgi:amino acid transporter